MKCNKCGCENDSNAVFCQNCGARIETLDGYETKDVLEKDMMIKCAYCGSSIRSTEEKCPYCDMKIDHHAEDITTVIPAENVKKNRFASYKVGNESKNSIIFSGGGILLSIISFFVFGFLSFIATGFSIVALVLSFKSKKSGDSNTLSLILALVSLVLSVVCAILYVIVLITVVPEALTLLF